MVVRDKTKQSLSYIPWIIQWSWVWEFCTCVIKFSGHFLCSSSNIAVRLTTRQRSLQIICVEWEAQRFLSFEPNFLGAFPTLWSAHYVHSACLPICPYRHNNSRTIGKDLHIIWHLGILEKIVSIFI
jgi:hypothetical protein